MKGGVILQAVMETTIDQTLKYVLIELCVRVMLRLVYGCTEDRFLSRNFGKTSGRQEQILPRGQKLICTLIIEDFKFNKGGLGQKRGV